MPLDVRRTIYLSPDDDCETALLAAVTAENRSIHLLCYALTDVALITMIIAKHTSGCDVGIVVDSTQAAGHTQRPLMQQLVDAGVPLTISRSPKGGILHQKVVLLGVAALGPAHNDSHILYGSFNLTGATAESQANVMVDDSDASVCAYFWAQYQELAAFGALHPLWQLTPALTLAPQGAPANG